MVTLKKYAFLFSVFLVIIGYAIFLKPLSAHQPEDMVVAYDEKNKVISIGVIHLSDKPQKHFIKEVTIRLNGKEIIKQVFLSQRDPKVQTASYVIEDANDKDTIEVVAVCSDKNSLKRTFKVE